MTTFYNDIAEDNLQIVKYQSELTGLSYATMILNRRLEFCETKEECNVIHNLLSDMETMETRIKKLIKEEIYKK